MWLNDGQVIDSAISVYRETLLSACPNYIVIDHLFDEVKLNEVVQVLRQSNGWQAQKHTYSALYVDSTEWEKADQAQHFVSRDNWKRQATNSNVAQEFLSFLRGDEFMYLLSRIFDVPLTDTNVAKPDVNTNFYRLNASDFVGLHADESPGREVCLLLYLNREWHENAGGELVFKGKGKDSIGIAPLYNRCVLFDPSSIGSEHWVAEIDSEYADEYRYNVTSWYWSE